MFGKLCSFLFPSPCAICGKAAGRNRILCSHCEKEFVPLTTSFRCRTCLTLIPSGADVCGSCLKSKPAYRRLISCAPYTGKLRTSLVRFKFRGRSDLRIPLGALMTERLTALGCTHYDIVVPVPLSKRRLRERGYNQSALLAEQIAKILSVPCETTVLVRHKETKRQAQLTAAERKKNVRGAFRLENGDAVQGKRVLLVDDIFTTGATMSEAAKVLASAAKCIDACAVALTQNPKFSALSDSV